MEQNAVYQFWGKERKKVVNGLVASLCQMQGMNLPIMFFIYYFEQSVNGKE
jgi:hypothetical protein